MTYGEEKKVAEIIEEFVEKIEALQRDNERIRQSQSYTYIGRDGKSVLARDLEDRAEIAEAEVKRLREKLEPFSWFAGVLFERNFNRTDYVAEMKDVDDMPHRIFAGPFFDARTALASAGEEHHAE